MVKITKTKPLARAQSKPYFDPVNPKVDFPKLEKDLYNYWEKKGIVKKYLERNKDSQKHFSFLDGPITANNPMGVHHAWGRTYKDLWQRFWNMRGYKQRFQNGFDCQGLWVEVEVEKELGLRSKRDIENLIEGDKKESIAKFVDLCKKRVYKYADIQTQQSKRLAYFMDWDNSYFTLSDENNYMIWHFLKVCHEKGLIYKGRDSVPWCPRCGTAISQHEMLTEDYKELVHDSLYVEYKLNEKQDEYLVIWTTTPWTLPANVAVAVGPEIDYVLASGSSSKKYYVSEEAAKKLNLKVIRKTKGKELIGLTYSSPFDDLDKVKSTFKDYVHRVISSDDRILPVTTEEGTGLVHIATGAGTEDFAIGKKEKLPVLEVIDEEANYLDGFGEFSFKNAKKHPELIVKYLKNDDSLLKLERYKHRYPACWRCKTELVWRVVDEWYIKIDPVRKDMKEVSKKINWIPKFGLKRELDWLGNMHDWLISKSRYWGLALPIWECEQCNEFQVIGSREELKEKAVNGWNEFSGHTPHKPWVDEVTINCNKCDGLAKRIPDVGNPWLDAGIVAYSTIAKDNKEKPLYKNDKKEWEKWFPANFITESFPGQFKNWFYSLIAMSTVLENRPPTQRVLGFATLLAEDGKPMHKSWGNSIEFNEGADKIGVDVMRWMYARQNYTDNLLFGYKVADETRRRFHLKLWNVFSFFVTYANLDFWKPTNSSTSKKPTSSNVLDEWIMQRLVQTTTEVTDYLENYNAYKSSESIDVFVNDFSNWYIRRSRDRVGPIAQNKKDKDDFYNTTYFVLTTLAKLLAPFTPYLAEIICRNLTDKLSVHLEDWPEFEKVNDTSLINEIILIREVAEKAHGERKENNIPVRQPLLELNVVSSKKPREEVSSQLLAELNVKKVAWKKGKELKVKLDKKITPELKMEADTRALIRKIQNESKKQGLNLSQKTSVQNDWVPTKKSLVDQLLRKTSSKQLTKSSVFKVTKTS